MASASAIADGILANIGAASVLGSVNVSKNSYQVLESAACAAAVVSWLDFQSQPAQYGGFDARDIWRFSADIYIRDTGNPIHLLNYTFTLPQLVLDSLKSDPTLQGTVILINSIAGQNSPGDVYTKGSHTWIKVPLVIQAVTDW
jgi:hypothetical protein